MLIINTDLWDDHRILKIRSGSKEEWKKPDSSLITKCILNQVKENLTKLIETEEKMILIVDLSKGSFPPWMQALSIAKFFVSLKKLIVKGLAFTLIYTVTEQQKTWIKRILMLYTPSRPMHMVNNKEEIKQKINEYKELSSV